MPDRCTTIRKHGFVLCLLLCLTAVAGAAPAVPALSGRVVDQAGLLSAAGRGRVEEAIVRLETATGGQMAVLTVPSLEGESIEQYSIRVAEQWKIGGKGKDNGLILVVARDDRATRLEVGYGWEGQINDARAGDILRGMQPMFGAGRFDDGVLYAVGQVQAFVTGQPAAAAPTPNATGTPRGGPPTWVLVLVIVIVVLALLSNASASGRNRGVVVYRGGRYPGGLGGGFRGGGGGFGGGFRGGGGSFGGGGASGRW